MIESAASENVVVVAMKNLFYDDFHMRCFFLNFYARIVLEWFCLLMMMIMKMIILMMTMMMMLMIDDDDDDDNDDDDCYRDGDDAEYDGDVDDDDDADDDHDDGGDDVGSQSSGLQAIKRATV